MLPATCDVVVAGLPLDDDAADGCWERALDLDSPHIDLFDPDFDKVAVVVRADANRVIAGGIPLMTASVRPGLSGSAWRAMTDIVIVRKTRLGSDRRAGPWP